MPDHLKAALIYRSKGWCVFPVRPPDTPRKPGKPYIKWRGLQKKLPSESLVRHWWEQWPDASIALLCGSVSDLIVVDIDPRNGGAEAGKHPLKQSPMVCNSGGGGAHYYYGFPLDQAEVSTQVNAKSKDPERKGRDVKADGSYVILPPSVHKSGKRYTWRRTGPLISAPSWALEPSSVGISEPDEAPPWITSLLRDGTEQGNRNDDTAKLGGYLAGKGIPRDIATGIIEAWLISTDTDRESGGGFGPDEVEVTLKSVYDTERRKKKNEARRSKVKGKARSDDDDLFLVVRQTEFMEKYGNQQVKWIVDKWLPDSTVGFIISPPGGYKSWLTFELAQCVAGGHKFLGEFDTKITGPVLVVQQEDFAGQTADRNALVLMSKFGLKPPTFNKGVLDFPVVPDVPVYYHPERRLKFRDKEVVGRLEEFVAKVRPKLMIVDPFYMASDLDEYGLKCIPDLEVLKDWRDEYGLSTLIVHHTRKAAAFGRKEAWGTGFLDAFSETLWHVRRPEDENEVAIRRYFKSEGTLPYVKVSFDIDTKRHRYITECEPISREEAEHMAANRSTKSADEPKRPNLKRSIVDSLATADESMSSGELALVTGEDEPKVVRALKKLESVGDVAQVPGGRWKHALPEIA